MATDSPQARRTDGYAPIRDYAIIGDGRTAALVALDGAIDWLCVPNFDSGSVFAAVLDADRGGTFRITPAGPFEAERRYLDGTNVLETTFRTAGGTVRLTDAMCLIGEGLGPMREIVRKVEALEGRVPLDVWFEPRFGYATRETRFRTTLNHVVAYSRADAVAIAGFGCDLEVGPVGAGGRIELEPGDTALLDVSFSNKEPLVFVGRDDAEERLERTRRFWASWSGRANYEGRWSEAVVRSALVLKLLVFSPSGAIVAAPTTSLPEEIGGTRNWDYRFTWLRDASWAIDALLRLGYRAEGHSFLWWFMHASRLTHPRLQILYRVNGSREASEYDLGFAGYRGSRPVRAGNAAADQSQLDVYGDVIHAVWLYVVNGGKLDRATAKEVAEVATWAAENWLEPDSGIWEVRHGPQQFVQSKALLWVALDRASDLARRDVIPDWRDRWEPAARDIHAFVEEHGWSDALQAYVRAPTMPELDASILTLPLLDWRGDDERMRRTIDAVRSSLRAGDGPLLYRYLGEDGVERGEGAFLACSFWLVDALAQTGRLEEAVETMDELLALANDVGLYSEEIDPDTGDFLGNMPQGLTHLALINAAVTIAELEAKQ